jgi:hypothetical protein
VTARGRPPACVRGGRRASKRDVAGRQRACAGGDARPSATWPAASQRESGHSWAPVHSWGLECTRGLGCTRGLQCAHVIDSHHRSAGRPCERSDARQSMASAAVRTTRRSAARRHAARALRTAPPNSNFSKRRPGRSMSKARFKHGSEPGAAAPISPSAAEDKNFLRCLRSRDSKGAIRMCVRCTRSRPFRKQTRDVEPKAP